MAEVALAAGFGSVRRFNETFQRSDRPPAALRLAADPQRASAGPDGLDASPCAIRPPYDWAAILGFLAAARHPGRRSGWRAASTPAPSPLDGAAGGVAVAQNRRRPRCGAASASRWPRRPAARSSPGCAACSTWPPIPRPSAPHLLARSAPGAAGRRAAGPAGARRMGRIRARRPRHPGPADHRGRRDRGLAGKLAARSMARLTGGAGPASASPISFPVPSASPRRATSPRSACPSARAAALAVSPPRSRRSRPLRARAQPGRAGGASSRPARHRRMDGAVHRHARAARARRLPRRRHRPDARPAMPAAAGPPRRALAARAEAWRPWRAYAALHLWASTQPADSAVPEPGAPAA